MRWRRDDADQLRAAHHGEIFLQGVDAADQRVGERVRRREGGKVGKHHLAHAHGIDDGLEEDALILNLRADHDEEAGQDEPGIMEEHAAHHGGKGEHLAQAGGGAAGESEAVLAGEAAAEQTAEIERIGGQKVEQAEEGLHPDHAAQQMCGVSRG